MSQQQFIPTPKFAEYKERFKDFYKMQRRADGVILVEAHTNGGPIQLSVENHRSVGQMLKTSRETRAAGAATSCRPHGATGYLAAESRCAISTTPASSISIRTVCYPVAVRRRHSRRRGHLR
jgi:hypothetical protein